MKVFLQLAVFLFGVSSALSALAAGVLETVSGDVRAGISAAAASAAKVSQRVSSAMTVTTGPKSSALIRFEDGQAIALHENSEFRIAEYSFAKDQPAKDKFGFELLKGALRSVTGTATRRTPDAYTLKTATATMGIRGTDFMVAIVNPVYFSVVNGAITVSNTAGAVSFAAGAAGTVTVPGALAVTIPFSALPAAVAATFSQLVGLTIVVDAAGALTATGAAQGAVTLPVGLGIAGALAAAVAAASANKENDGQPAATSTTGTTSTR